MIVQVVERWSRNLVVGGGGGGGGSGGPSPVTGNSSVSSDTACIHTVSSSYSIHVSMKYVYMHFLLKIQSRYIHIFNLQYINVYISSYRFRAGLCTAESALNTSHCEMVSDF